MSEKFDDYEIQEGCTVQPQNKEELVDIIRDAITVMGDDADLNFIDTSKITDMSNLFAGPGSSFYSNFFTGYGFGNFNGNISKWNVSNVTNMSFMFDGNLKFNQPLNDWDVSHVTNMYAMFDNAESFNQSLDQWDVCNVTDMSCMFSGTKSFNQPLNNWNTSNVKNMYMMFAYSSFNQPLNDWNVSNVTSMHCMFIHNKSFNLPLDEWDTKNVSKMGNIDMFKDAENFDNKIPSLKNFEFKRFDDKCFLLGLSHKYAEKHQHDF